MPNKHERALPSSHGTWVDRQKGVVIQTQPDKTLQKAAVIQTQPKKTLQHELIVTSHPSLTKVGRKWVKHQDQ